MDVVVYPAAEEGIPAGFYLLNTLPPSGSVLLPDAFIVGGGGSIRHIFSSGCSRVEGRCINGTFQ